MKFSDFIKLYTVFIIPENKRMLILIRLMKLFGST